MAKTIAEASLKELKLCERALDCIICAGQHDDSDLNMQAAIGREITKRDLRDFRVSFYVDEIGRLKACIRVYLDVIPDDDMARNLLKRFNDILKGDE